VIVHVSLEGCRFASGGAPRARVMTASLQRKLVRLAKGERVKPTEKSGVKEKNVAEFGPPRITIAFARHQVKEVLEEDCAGYCAASKVAACTRESAAAVRCQVEATLESGTV
jgi:hypothetical protein